MRTERDVWEWIWDDDDESILPPLEEFVAERAAVESPDDDLERLARSVLLAVRDAEPQPDDEPGEDLQAEGEELERATGGEPAEVLPFPTARERVLPEPVLPQRVATTLVVAPQRARRGARKRVRRRLLLIGVVAALLAAAAFGAIELVSRPEPRPAATPPAPAVAADQQVVAFALWDERGPGYLAVLTGGGGKEPVALIFPDATSETIPGHGLGTVGDAIESGDVTVIQATAENILGVRVDDALGLPLEQLAPLVDAVGLLDLGGDLASGDEVVAYLREGGRAPAPERLARWHEVLASLLAAAERTPDALDDLPARLRPVFSTGAEVVQLPTTQIGAGLVSADDEAVRDLVAERFVPSATAGTAEVRLVVLNGNGTPGVGEAVARLLVPEGFRLITNENAETFGLKETQIIATSRQFLDEARLARRLLGVGTVYAGGPPSTVADVTVVVGDDFRSP